MSRLLVIVGFPFRLLLGVCLLPFAAVYALVLEPQMAEDFLPQWWDFVWRGES